MGELGRITTSVYDGAAASNPAQVRIAGSARTAPIMITDDDAAAATIRNTYRLETADAHQNIGSGESLSIWPLTMAEFVKAIREKVARFLELLEQIAGGRFMSGNLAENLAQMSANLESGLFSPAQAAQEALKISPFRDIEPEQVLFLLRSD